VRGGADLNLQNGERMYNTISWWVKKYTLSNVLCNDTINQDWVGKSRWGRDHQNIVCIIHPCGELQEWSRVVRAGAVQWHHFQHRVGTVACVLLVRAGADINLQNKVHVRPRCGEIQLCNDIKALSWTRKVGHFWKAYSHQYVPMVSDHWFLSLPSCRFNYLTHAKGEEREAGIDAADCN
jgi:hypothetical protein